MCWRNEGLTNRMFALFVSGRVISDHTGHGFGFYILPPILPSNISNYTNIRIIKSSNKVIFNKSPALWMTQPCNWYIPIQPFILLLFATYVVMDRNRTTNYTIVNTRFILFFLFCLSEKWSLLSRAVSGYILSTNVVVYHKLLPIKINGIFGTSPVHIYQLFLS